MKYLRSFNLTFPVSSAASSAKLFHLLCFMMVTFDYIPCPSCSPFLAFLPHLLLSSCFLINFSTYKGVGSRVTFSHMYISTPCPAH